MLNVIQMDNWLGKPPAELLEHIEGLWKQDQWQLVLLLSGDKVIGSMLSPASAERALKARLVERLRASEPATKGD